MAPPNALPKSTEVKRGDVPTWPPSEEGDGATRPVANPPVDFWGDQRDLGRILAGEPPIEEGSPRAQSNDVKFTMVDIKYNQKTRSAAGTKVIAEMSVDPDKLLDLLLGKDVKGFEQLPNVVSGSVKACEGKLSYQTEWHGVKVTTSLNMTVLKNEKDGNKFYTISWSATGEEDKNNVWYRVDKGIYRIRVAPDGKVLVGLRIDAEEMVVPEKLEDTVMDPVVQRRIPGQLEEYLRARFMAFPALAK